MQFDQLKLREFITLLGGAAAAWPLAVGAQQNERVRTIGILASQPLPPIQRFARKLRDYGYIEGQNLRLISRFAEGRDDRYPAMAAELAMLPVDLIVTWGTPATLAAKQATTTNSHRDGRHWRSGQCRYRLESRAPRWKYHRLRRTFGATPQEVNKHAGFRW